MGEECRQKEEPASPRPEQPGLLGGTERKVWVWTEEGRRKWEEMKLEPMRV